MRCASWKKKKKKRLESIMKKRCGHRFLTWKQNSWNPHTLKTALVYSQHSDNINKPLSFPSTQRIPTIHCNVPAWQLLFGHFTKDLETMWAHSVFHSRPKKKKKTGCVIATLAHWSVSLVLRCPTGLAHTRSHSSRTFQLALPPPWLLGIINPPNSKLFHPAEILPKPPPVALHTQIGICVAYT